MDINIDSQIVVQTEAQWALDATVYSEKRLLVSSDATYTGTDQRKFKIPNGVDTWSNLDYFSASSTIDINGNIDTEFRVAQGDTGALTYGGVTAASTTQVNIGACTGYVVDNESNPASPSFTYVTYAGASNVTVPTIATGIISYLLLDNTGSLVWQNTFPTSAQRKTHIYLSKVSHPNLTTIGAIGDEPDFILSPLAQFRDVFQAINYINDGLHIYANNANLNVATTTGNIHGNGINFIDDNTNPNEMSHTGILATSFFERTQTGLGGGLVTSIDVANYDVGGTITPIGGGTQSSTLRYFFAVPTNNGIGFICQYGQTVYSNLAQAIAAVGTESFTIFPNLVRNAILLGVIAATRTATDLTNTTQARIFSADKFGEIIGAQAGVSVGTLQTAYNNSIDPEIVTDSTRDGVTVKRGSAADTDNIIVGQNGAGTTTFLVKGDGTTGVGVSSTSARFHVGASAGVNGGIKLDLLANHATPSSSYTSIDFQTLAGLMGQFLLTASNYSPDGNTNLTNNALALIAYGNQLDLSSAGYTSFCAGGYTAAFERMRIKADGKINFPALTASTIQYLDSSKDLTSLPNAFGALTNDGSGVIAYNARIIRAQRLVYYNNF